jgi:Mn-dependent DtxR family transcriptional regulator
MPRHVADLQDGEPFPVKPGTNEYEALSFLVRNHDYGFSPTEIAEQTEISTASASKTMARLFEKGLVTRTEGMYYVEPDRANDLQQRLQSLDAAVRLFETVPEDDAYAETRWEDDVPSIVSETDRRYSPD